MPNIKVAKDLALVAWFHRHLDAMHDRNSFAVKPIHARKLRTWRMCLLVACLAGVPWLALDAQTAERVVVQAPATAAKVRHLHIDFGVPDTEYRRQVLALTPLGSTYEEVRQFVENEWAFERVKLNATYRADRLRLCPSVFAIPRNYFTVATRDLVRAEPPHIAIADLDDPFASQQGRQYMVPYFFHRPVFWKNEIAVSVWYVFDARRRLIDVFADGCVERPQSW